MEIKRNLGLQQLQQLKKVEVQKELDFESEDEDKDIIELATTYPVSKKSNEIRILNNERIITSESKTKKGKLEKRVSKGNLSIIIFLI